MSFEAVISIWIASIVAGVVVGGNRGSLRQGILCGMLFGPLGVVVALSIDNRAGCPHCTGKLDRRENSVCQHCGREIKWVRAPFGVRSTPVAATDGVESPPKEVAAAPRRQPVAR